MLFLNDYQQAASKFRTKDTPDSERAFGLAEETGEVMGVLKRYQRGDWVLDGSNGIDTTKEKLTKELGDVLWYLSQVATDWDIKLEVIAKTNIAKLQDRMDRNTLKGTGSTR